MGILDKVTDVLGNAVRTIKDLRIDANLFNNKLITISSFLGNQRPAMSYDFEVNVFNPILGLNETLLTTSEITPPTWGLIFSSDAEFGHSVIASEESYSPVSLTFWDTKDLKAYRAVDSIYDSQINKEYQSLKIGYNQTIVTIVVCELFSMKIEKCAFTKPLPVSLDVSSEELLKFSTDITYEKFEIKLDPATERR